MGWTMFQKPLTKKEVIERTLSGEFLSVVPIEHCLKGNNLWVVLPSRRGGPDYICLIKLEKYDGSYCFKAIPEEEGPYGTGCPTKWFKKYPTTSESALSWRKRVLDHQADQKVRKTIEIQQGMKIDLGTGIYTVQRKSLDPRNVDLWIVTNEEGKQFTTTEKKLRNALILEEEEPFDPIASGWVGKDGRP